MTDQTNLEIERQFDVAERLWDTLDHKFEILIGVTITIVGFILSQASFFDVFRSHDYPLGVLYALGLLLTMLAGYVSFLGFRVRDFELGVNLDRLVPGDDQAGASIHEELRQSTKRNYQRIDVKTELLQRSFACLGLGLLALVTARLLFAFLPS
ncbi:MAG: hypothetical protein HY092_01545 [Candidatus Kerfeldbacteria bacterium]|nr:hypothetical protein [Candidatus Kerfeldbacteria bacterium]